MAENPYAPPKADINVPEAVMMPPQKMPGTVIATIVIVGVITLLELGTALAQGAIPNPIGLGIRVLIIVGLWRGHALAWQWGIVIPVLVILATLAMGGLALENSNPNAVALLVGVIAVSALYVSIIVLLSLRPSRVFFGLQCPKCGQVKGRAASFLFHKRRCRACKFEWTPAPRAR